MYGDVLINCKFQKRDISRALAHAQQHFAGLVNCAKHMLMPFFKAMELNYSTAPTHVRPLQLFLSTQRPNTKKKRDRIEEQKHSFSVCCHTRPRHQGNDQKQCMRKEEACVKAFKGVTAEMVLGLSKDSTFDEIMDEAGKALCKDLKVFLSQSSISEVPTQVISAKGSANAGLCSSKQEAVIFPIQLYSATTEPPSNLGVSSIVPKKCMPKECATSVTMGKASEGEPMPSTLPRTDARSRWKRVTHTVTLINHMVANIRCASADLLEGSAVNEILQQEGFQVDAGGLGAATFEGAKTVARFRRKGRKGMEGLLVRQGTGFLSFFQGFYVAFLKDYFVCDGDVVWEGDYVDFIHVGDKGQCVLDHSQIDLLKPMKGIGQPAENLSRLNTDSRLKPQGKDNSCLRPQSDKDERGVALDFGARCWLSHPHKRRLLKSLSTSFTQAEC
ncbi:hypothetical protein GOP47_0001680 [Adiantum capillus-veneris]|uniref:Uncharacterized protein n=1 Tax=Adiantum capillus-veneris TaxID=13818 RepID=A0A9D4ZQC5_ADICA|nr:hypothetical protein GOP47_0001680 [Adiantum capillus-veneris]